MKRALFTAATMLLMIFTSVLWAQRPNVYILATGGTIAGSGSSATKSNYSAGQVAIGTLLDAVPAIRNVADVEGEQVVNIGSQDMSDEVWLILAKRINELLARADVDGIVVTHGTDTMEETAFFLSLTVSSSKPVVLVGAMRPSTAISADGPANLYNAVITAASPESKNRGVMVCMNGKVFGASDVTKTNTTSVETFQSPNAGPLGYIHNGEVHYYNQAQARSNALYFSVKKDYKGIVYAGVGNGNIHKNVFPELEKARKKGIIVVRSSRVPTGATTLDAEVDDNKYEFVASWGLNPQKARVLLMLALTKTDDWKTIQKYFNNY